MPEASQDQEIRAFAKKSLKKKAEFRQYLWVTAGVSALVTVIWALTTPGQAFWPIWVYFGMGIGAFFAGIDAYGKFTPKPITDADIDAEVERMRRKG